MLSLPDVSIATSPLFRASIHRLLPRVTMCTPFVRVKEEAKSEIMLGPINGHKTEGLDAAAVTSSRRSIVRAPLPFFFSLSLSRSLTRLPVGELRGMRRIFSAPSGQTNFNLRQEHLPCVRRTQRATHARFVTHTLPHIRLLISLLDTPPCLYDSGPLPPLIAAIINMRG